MMRKKKSSETTKRKRRVQEIMQGKIGAIILAVVLVLALVCGVICLEKVPAGYVGVVYNMNGALTERFSHRDGTSCRRPRR